MAKYKNAEEANEALKAAKEEREVARTEFKDFRKENKIKQDDPPPTDEKLLKKYTKLLDIKTKKEKACEEIKTWLTENKPKKEKKERVSKYDYPADASALDKKKFRAKKRAADKAAKKKEEKGEKETKKKDKKEGKKEEGKESKKKDKASDDKDED